MKPQMLLFIATFVASGLAGLGALLRSESALSVRMVLSAFLNSGLLGLAIYMFWVNNYGENTSPWNLMGIAILSGLGGYKAIDFILDMVRLMVQNKVKPNDNQNKIQ